MNNTEKSTAIKELRNLSSDGKRSIQESTGMTIEEIISDIQSDKPSKGFVYYTSLIANAAGLYGVSLLVLSSIAAPMVLTISATAGVAALTGMAAKKFLAKHPQK